MKRCSDVNPSSACITDRVTSSASDSLGVIPTPPLDATAQGRGFQQQVGGSHVACGREGVEIGIQSLTPPRFSITQH